MNQHYHLWNRHISGVFYLIYSTSTSYISPKELLLQDANISQIFVFHSFTHLSDIKSLMSQDMLGSCTAYQPYPEFKMKQRKKVWNNIAKTIVISHSLSIDFSNFNWNNYINIISEYTKTLNSHTLYIWLLLPKLEQWHSKISLFFL